MLQPSPQLRIGIKSTVKLDPISVTCNLTLIGQHICTLYDHISHGGYRRNNFRHVLYSSLKGYLHHRHLWRIHRMIHQVPPHLPTREPAGHGRCECRGSACTTLTIDFYGISRESVNISHIWCPYAPSGYRDRKFKWNSTLIMSYERGGANLPNA